MILKRNYVGWNLQIGNHSMLLSLFDLEELHRLTTKAVASMKSDDFQEPTRTPRKDLFPEFVADVVWKPTGKVLRSDCIKELSSRRHLRKLRGDEEIVVPFAGNLFSNLICKASQLRRREGIDLEVHLDKENNRITISKRQ